MAGSDRNTWQFHPGNNGFQGFRRRKPLGVGGVKVNHQPYGALHSKAESPDPEPANLDFSGKFVHAPDNQPAVAGCQANTVIAD